MAHSPAPDLKSFMDYDYPVDFDGDSGPAAVIRMVRPGSRVLEIGAGSGSIARPLVERNKCSLVALENNPRSVEKLKAFCTSVHNLDLNDEQWPEKLLSSASLSGEQASFDYVIAADVLEHLYDPWSVLKAMKRLLNNNGRIILSLPHASHSAVVAAFYSGDVKLNEWGLLDKTHIRFFGLKNIDALYESAGLSIVNVHYVLRPPEKTEFAGLWKYLQEDVKEILSRRSLGDIYQVVTEAMPSDKVTTPITLEDSLPKSDRKLSDPPGLLRRIIRRFA